MEFDTTTTFQLIQFKPPFFLRFYNRREPQIYRDDREDTELTAVKTYHGSTNHTASELYSNGLLSMVMAIWPIYYH